ncbi:MAG: LysO family transporter [Bacteroides sp.]
MFIIIGIMLTGMLIGYLLRSKKLSWIHRIITVLIWLLLFLLGIDVGGNQTIIQGLHTLGLEAALITIAAVAGSVLASWALWYLIYTRPTNRKKKKEEERL